MREESRNRRSAVVYALGSLAFLAVAALNFWERQLALGAMLLVGSWAWCVLGVYFSARGIGSRTEAHRASPDGEGSLECDSCPACGCRVFTRAAGRRICACCGTVQEERHGTAMR